MSSWVDDKDAPQTGFMSCVYPERQSSISQHALCQFEDEDDDEDEYAALALYAQQPVDARFLRGLKLQMPFNGGCDKRQIVPGQPPADKGEQ